MPQDWLPVLISHEIPVQCCIHLSRTHHFLHQKTPGSSPDRHDNACRSLRLGSYGLTIDGPIGHAWYKFLDKHVYPDNPQCTAAVLIKTAADQIAWAPIMTCVYFAFLRTLEGHPELIVSTIQVHVCLCEVIVCSEAGVP